MKTSKILMLFTLSFCFIVSTSTYTHRRDRKKCTKCFFKSSVCSTVGFVKDGVKDGLKDCVKKTVTTPYEEWVLNPFIDCMEETFGLNPKKEKIDALKKLDKQIAWAARLRAAGVTEEKMAEITGKLMRKFEALMENE